MSNLHEKTKSIFLRYGVQRANRFKVTIPLPKKMTVEAAETTSESFLDRVKEVAGYAAIALGVNSKGERSLQFTCRATEFPGVQFSTESTEINGHTFKYATNIERDVLSFAFQLTGDLFEKKILDEWKSLIVNETTRRVGYPDDYVVDIQIDALDQQDVVMYSVTVVDAYPATIGAIQLNKLSTDTASSIETSWQFTRLKPTDSDKEDQLIPGNVGGIIEGIKNGDLEAAAYSARMLAMQVASGDFSGEAGALYGRINDVMRDSVGFSTNDIERATGNLSTMVNKATNIGSGEKNALTSLLKGLV